MSYFSRIKPSHPVPRIFDLSDTWVIVLPEGEEFLLMLYGFALPAFLLINLAEHVEALGVDVSISYPSRPKGNYPFVYVVKRI